MPTKNFLHYDELAKVLFSLVSILDARAFKEPPASRWQYSQRSLASLLEAEYSMPNALRPVADYYVAASTTVLLLLALRFALFAFADRRDDRPAQIVCHRPCSSSVGRVNVLSMLRANTF